MGKIALALAILAYVIPVATQVWLRPPPGETGHGMFWLVMTGGSLLLAALLSGLGTALAVTDLRDAAKATNPVAAHRLQLAFMAAPAILVVLLGVAVAVWAAA